MNDSTSQYPTLHFLLLNAGHLLDHLCLLVFATAVTLALQSHWQLSYAELIPYATPCFFAFGAFSIPAGYLADRWSREGMMVVFFLGIAGSLVLCSLATTPLQLGVALTIVGMFAAIYHPVGIALVLSSPRRTAMRVAVNGVWGNLGVASAALITAWLIHLINWRLAFLLPAVASLVLGFVYWHWIFRNRETSTTINNQKASDEPLGITRDLLVRTLIIIFLTTAIGGLLFQSTTFALPEIIAERLDNILADPGRLGSIAFIIFMLGSGGQLVVGYALDRLPVRTIFITIAIAQIVFFLLMIGATGYRALLAACGFMLATFGQIPVNDILVGRVAKSHWRSRILGIRYTINISVMALTLPLIALIHASYGFDRLFVLLCLASLVILMLVTALPAAIAQPAQEQAAR